LVEQATDAAREAAALRQCPSQLVVEQLDPCFPEVLRSIRGDVGIGEHLLDAHRVVALRVRDTDTRRDVHFVTVDVVRRADSPDQAFGHRGGDRR
jgi:hypothetical protein